MPTEVEPRKHEQEVEASSLNLWDARCQHPAVGQNVVPPRQFAIAAESVRRITGWGPRQFPSGTAVALIP